MISKVFVEITNRCNLSCPFCPPTRRSADSMDRARFASVLEGLTGHAKLLYFHLKGEPLLHPLLGDFLEMAHAAGFAVSITTNGTLLEERGALLLNAPALKKLSVSLQSHASAHVVPFADATSPLERYLEGVFSFLDQHRDQASFPTSLRLWTLSGGILPRESNQLVDLLSRRYPRLSEQLAAVLSSGAGGSSASIPGIRLEEGVYLNLAKAFTWPSIDYLPAAGAGGVIAPVRGRCHGLRTQIGILVDGSVVPCCLDSDGAMSLGHLLEDRLEDILERPRARALREGFSRGILVEDLCQHCGYRELNEGSWRGGRHRPLPGTAS